MGSAESDALWQDAATALNIMDYFLSYNRIPWMRNASISDALNVQMCGRNAIEWPNLDVDLEIESLKHPERYPLIMKRNELDNCR